MKGWAELKQAFWAVIERGPEERTRQMATLAGIDPELPHRLDALLAADARGESLQHLFEVETPAAPHPTRIGGYEVIAVLGVGGMGEVYRARDTRLQRDVAIKVLPAALANDRERLARFEREAQLLASLNHPNIAQLYGLDESGPAPALVMELVTGPTLATVIAGQPVAVPRALDIARQIADALDAAHEKGVIHRDLKPSNVALTQDGAVKILDFGIAKSLDPDTLATVDPSAMTEDGRVLGTPAYMSPEQARRSTVDRRTDIWAFGCVLYELLSGRQAFGGSTTADSIAAVLQHDPDLSILPPTIPTGVRTLLRHCLEKNPKHRLRDIADARLTLDDAMRPTEQPIGREVAAQSGRTVTWAAWLVGAGIVTGIAVLARQGPDPSLRSDPPRKTVASIVLPRRMRFGGGDLEAQSSEQRFAVSPDGRRLALIAADDSPLPRLWIRDFGSAAFVPVSQTDNASFPFWSADSESIGFVAAGTLKAVRVPAGTPMTVNDQGYRLGAWSRDNQILFAPSRSAPLYVVPAAGGTARAVTTLDSGSGEVQHGYPAFLPDGRHFLYVGVGSKAGGVLDARGISVASLDGREPPVLLLPRATQARYASGHLLFVQRGTLMAQPFDIEHNVLRGTAVPLIEDVRLSTVGATGPTAAFSVSDNGVLVYQSATRIESRPVVLDRTGKQLTALANAADYGDVALSPDGLRVAVSVTDPTLSTRDLWLYDLADGRAQRLTFERGDEFAPVWSPDGSRLLFSAQSGSLINLQIVNVRDSRTPTPLEVDALGLGRFAADWSRDGRQILYIGGGRAVSMSDLWVAPLAAPRQAHPLLESSFVETQGRFAPDGRWFAYASNETGQLEVYVDRYPDRGARQPVSTKGGRWPRWSHDGSELFYVSPDNELISVAIKNAGDRLDISAPRVLFTIRPRPPVRLDAYPYDVSPDGRQFVVNALVDDTTSSAITVVFNWTEGLTSR